MERERRIIERPGLRYERCGGCGRRWNVPVGMVLVAGEYICPVCARRREYAAWAAAFKRMISK